ncbi:MAG: type II toxin-antitoxin system HipA family toxin, partial [Propionicimonas sp.]
PGDGRMALAVNGRYRHLEITGNDLVEEFASWGVKRAEETVRDTLDQLQTIINEEDPLAGAFPRLQEQLSGFVHNLRHGSPVGGR